MRYLRTNTATIVTVGPFLDKTDGVTLETALTITNERISLTVDLNDGSAPTLVLDNVTGATSGTSNDLNYITNNDAGLMQLELAAANVNYLGRAFLTITDAANHCPVFHEFMILPAVIFDSLVAGTDLFDVSMTQILGTAVSSPATAGVLDVNLKNIANAAVSTSTAQLGVNAVQIGASVPGSATVGTVTNLTNAPTAGDLTATMKASVTTAATAATPTAAAVTGAVGSVTAPVTAGTVSDKTGYALSSAGVQAIWDALTSALTTVGSVGKRIADYLDIAISSRGTSTYAGGDTSGTTTLLGRIIGTLATGTHSPQTGDSYARIGAAGAGLTALGDTRLANLDATVSSRNATTPPTVGAIADQVWDEAMGAHATPGTSGAILIDIIEDTSTTIPLAVASIGTIPATSAIADAVWDEALSGHATSGTAGKKLTDLANADLSGVATASALATLAGYVDTEVAAILADTNELQTDLVNGGRLDLLIDAIKAKTDNLPTDPADQSAVEAAITAATSPLATAAALTTVAGYIDTEVASILAAVDTEVAAIKAKTDNLPASPAAVGSAMTLTAAYDAAKTAATQTSVDDLPTNAELATALGTADDATLAAIAALNNLSSAQAQTAATAALNAYDPPTNAEMEARTLVSASYATATALDAVDNFIDTEVAAIKAVTDKIDTALVLDGAVYQLTANALELAPTGSESGASAQEVWEYAGGSGRTINSVSGSVSNVLAIGGVTMAEGSIPGVAAGQAGGLALYGSAGLTAQETADAVNNLAPAGASGAAGSIRSKLDAIQSVTDDIDVSAVTLATGNNAGSLTFVVGSVFDQTLTGLTTIPSDWTECIFSLKVEKDRDLDSESLVQIKVTNGGDVGDGLLYLSRSAPVSPITKADASLTVTQAAGTARIVVSSAALALLTGGRSSLDWDLKVFKTGGWSKVETSGDARIDWTPTRTT